MEDLGQLSDHSKHYMHVPAIIIITTYQAHSGDTVNRNKPLCSHSAYTLVVMSVLHFSSSNGKMEHVHHRCGLQGGSMATSSPVSLQVQNFQGRF